MKSLKPIGKLFIKCLGVGIAYGSAIGISLTMVMRANHEMCKESKREGYSKGLEVGSMMKSNERVESE